MSRARKAACRTRRRRCALGSGSCRDFAVLMMEAVRSLGWRRVSCRAISTRRSARIRRPAAGASVGGGATHAWLQVYLPGAGWVEFDPTNGIVGNRDLIRVAVVRDPRQAVPLSGTWTGFPSDNLGMTVEVDGHRRQRRPEGMRRLPNRTRRLVAHVP